MLQVSTEPARLAAYCRRAWAKSPECHGLFSLCLALRKGEKCIDIGCLIRLIAQYLVPYELAVCVRTGFAGAGYFDEEPRGHFQVVNPRTQEIVVTQILERPRLLCSSLVPVMDRVAVAPDFKCYAMLCHCHKNTKQCTMLEVSNHRRVIAQRFFYSELDLESHTHRSHRALKFSPTDGILLACSADGDTRLYEVDVVEEAIYLMWRRTDIWTDQLRFWGSVGDVAVAPIDSDGVMMEILCIDEITRVVMPLFKLSSAGLAIEVADGEVASISAFASSSTKDVLSVALTSMQVFKFRIDANTNFPVTHADCEFTIKLVTSPACIVAMDWSGVGIILGDSHGRFYIVRDDTVVVMNTNGSVAQRYDDSLPTRCYVPALSAPCSSPVSEVIVCDFR